MKKLVSIIVFLAAVISGTAQITVSSNSKVGIGITSPTEKLEVVGNIKVTGDVKVTGAVIPVNSTSSVGQYSNRWGYLFAVSPVFSYNPTIDSDSRLKKDVKKMDPVLDKIKTMQAVSYKLIGTGNEKDDLNENKVVYGFIAQDVKSIFPDVVEQTQDSLLGIRYGDFIPVLLQAIQEQQTQIEALQKQVKELISNSKN
jgi:hypothetical protein